MWKRTDDYLRGNVFAFKLSKKKKKKKKLALINILVLNLVL